MMHLFVGLFYYLLGNLSPYLRSQLKSIQLIAVAKAPTIVKYGADAVMETFMDDLKTLEEVCHLRGGGGGGHCVGSDQYAGVRDGMSLSPLSDAWGVLRVKCTHNYFKIVSKVVRSGSPPPPSSVSIPGSEGG